jgi:hypothetical protein
LANGWPLTWKVLLVEPWTAGQAPVASVYQPAPVFGGACVRSPLPDADAPLRSRSRMVGITPRAAYFLTRSWRSPSEVKNTARSDGLCLAPAGAAGAAVAGGAASRGARATTAARAAIRSRLLRVTRHLREGCGAANTITGQMPTGQTPGTARLTSRATRT